MPDNKKLASRGGKQAPRRLRAGCRELSFDECAELVASMLTSLTLAVAAAGAAAVLSVVYCLRLRNSRRLDADKQQQIAETVELVRETSFACRQHATTREEQAAELSRIRNLSERALRLGAAAGSANEWAPPAAHPTIAALSALADGLDDEEEAPWDDAASDDAASDAPQSEAGGHQLQARFSVLAADDGGSRGRGRSCCSDVGIGAASPGRGAARLQAVREFHGEDEEDDGARSAVSAATVLQRAPFKVLFTRRSERSP